MISLFTTIFIPPNDQQRWKELIYCLNKNLNNSLILNIYIFLDGCNDEETKTAVIDNVPITNKIQFIEVGHIPRFGDWIKYSKQFAPKLNDISVFANADIYLDETAKDLKEYANQSESIVCLSRHEFVSETEATPHPNPQWSQDLWAISKQNILSITNTYFIDELNILPTGVCRCDNKVAYIFAMRGWKVFNPFPQIKIYHMQRSSERAYSKLDTNLVGSLCFPSPTDSSTKPSELDINVMPVNAEHITKCAINNYLHKNLLLEPKSKTYNIGFFGASVTKQQNGYVKFFERLCNHNILQHGYGGMHLKDAGIVFIDEVCKNKLDYCFIEWFTPSISGYKKENLFLYLDTIVYKLLLNDCVPIFLFLRGTTSACTFDDKVQDYNLIISEYCLSKNLPYFEAYKDVNVSCMLDEEILRDSVHTNDKGSELYAKAIMNYFNFFVKDKVDIKTISIPKETKFQDIKTLQFNEKVTTGFLIKGNAELIGIYQDVGPFSCFCDVYVDGVQLHSKRPIIDMHCHYIRSTINFNYTFNKSLLVTISPDDIDYSSIVKNNINWAHYKKEGIEPQQKELRLQTLHYIGEIQDITII